MAWTFDEKSPIYAQIMQHIKMKIVSYDIKSGEQLPTVRDFAEEAGVNPNTMQRAFTELEREGMVFSRRTAGRYVTEDQELIAQKRHELAKDEVTNFVTKMQAIGFDKDSLLAELKDHLDNL